MLQGVDEIVQARIRQGCAISPQQRLCWRPAAGFVDAMSRLSPWNWSVDMARRTFSRAFMIKAVALVTGRGVSVAQACRDLELANSVLRQWMRVSTEAPIPAFPGNRPLANGPGPGELARGSCAYAGPARSSRWSAICRTRRTRPVLAQAGATPRDRAR